MKRQVLLLFLPLFGSRLLAQDQIKPADVNAGPAALSETVVAQTPYAIASRDGNQKVWSRVTWQSNALTRELTTKTNSFIELATASAHLVNGVWVDSSDQIQITKTGAQATNSQHQVAFLGNINSPGAIDLTLPEGDKHLVSSIIGLSYMDASGKSVLIAELKDSIGQLLPSGNQVLYPDAFTDFSADVLYVNNISGFEQLIILRQQPPSPAEWGLDPDTTLLQVITEFFNPPSPLITHRKIGSAIDEHLDFGITQMPRGVAFALGAETNTIPVTKQWLLLEGRQCLVESTPFTLIEPLMKDLPPPPVQARLHDSPASVLHRLASGHLLPNRKLANKNSPAMQLARATPSQKGVALDYTTVTSQTNYTFQASSTYFVGSTNITLSGTTIFEGGAVIKFTNLSNATISMSGASFVASTSPLEWLYLPQKTIIQLEIRFQDQLEIRQIITVELIFPVDPALTGICVSLMPGPESLVMFKAAEFGIASSLTVQPASRLTRRLFSEMFYSLIVERQSTEMSQGCMASMSLPTTSHNSFLTLVRKLGLLATAS